MSDKTSDKNKQAIKTSDKLRNCPFCGGKAWLREHTALNGETNYYVECGYIECGVSPETSIFVTSEEAIKAWNARKPMERIVEHLKRKKNPTLLLGPSWLSREERISQQKGYCKAFEEAIEIVKEEGGIE